MHSGKKAVPLPGFSEQGAVPPLVLNNQEAMPLPVLSNQEVVLSQNRYVSDPLEVVVDRLFSDLSFQSFCQNFV